MSAAGIGGRIPSPIEDDRRPKNENATRRHFLIQIDAHLSSCLARRPLPSAAPKARRRRLSAAEVAARLLPAPSPARRLTPTATKSWETFTTSRLAEFRSQRELVAQIGHAVADWPLAILKALVDNAIDIAEEIGTAPTVNSSVESACAQPEILWHQADGDE